METIFATISLIGSVFFLAGAYMVKASSEKRIAKKHTTHHHK